MSSNSVKDIYYLCNDRQRQEKLASLILYTKHMLKSDCDSVVVEELVYDRKGNIIRNEDKTFIVLCL